MYFLQKNNGNQDSDFVRRGIACKSDFRKHLEQFSLLSQNVECC